MTRVCVISPIVETAVASLNVDAFKRLLDAVHATGAVSFTTRFLSDGPSSIECEATRRQTAWA
jgi:hypothetical protein